MTLSAERYPFMKNVAVTEEGFDFAELKKRIDEKDKASMREGFKELIGGLFDILAKLTGNVLVDRLMREVDGLRDLRVEHAA